MSSDKADDATQGCERRLALEIHLKREHWQCLPLLIGALCLALHWLDPLCVSNEHRQSWDCALPAVLRQEALSSPVLLLVQGVYVVNGTGHQDNQKEGDGADYATSHLQNIT